MLRSVDMLYSTKLWCIWQFTTNPPNFYLPTDFILADFAVQISQSTNIISKFVLYCTYVCRRSDITYGNYQVTKGILSNTHVTHTGRHFYNEYCKLYTHATA